MMDDIFTFTEKVRVIHVHDRLGKPYEVYCGRPNPHYGFAGSPLCNPFPADSERDRNRVCDEYERYFLAQIESGFPLFVNELERLANLYYNHGKLDLVCWCKPKRCHCDTIQRYLNNTIKPNEDR